MHRGGTRRFRALSVFIIRLAHLRDDLPEYLVAAIGVGGEYLDLVPFHVRSDRGESPHIRTEAAMVARRRHERSA